MKEPRNPFRIRMSQRIESDATFLRMFGAGVLDVLSQDDLWGRVQIIQSAPGGGKTSLLRAFTPSALLGLHESRGLRGSTGDQLRDLRSAMERIGAMTEAGPTVLGIMPSNAGNYAILEDLSLDAVRKERLFYSLFNARVIKAMLRGTLRLHKLLPDALNRIEVAVPHGVDIPPQFPLPCSGEVLYEWAQRLEHSICKAMDDFGPPLGGLEGHDSLHALEFLRPECITLGGKPVAQNITVMLDDFHMLSSIQRHKFRNKLFTMRIPIGVWLAERLEALNPNELLSNDIYDGTAGREYNEVRLESYWRSKRVGRTFETFVSNIADLRVYESEDVRSNNLIPLSFTQYLGSSLEPDWNSVFESAAATIADRLQAQAQTTHLYDNWIANRTATEGTPLERAVNWRHLEIMMARQDNRSQKSLDLGMALPEEELKDEIAERQIAEYFLSREFGVPYYFGSRRLANLSSFNIEQFLAMSAEIFEEVTATALVRKVGHAPMITPSRQEAILKKAALTRWQEIPRRHGREVQTFLEALGRFAQQQTMSPTASYLAVTGFGLTEKNLQLLLDVKERALHPQYKQLLHTLSVCVSSNLLEAERQQQGQKGEQVRVFYLNRWLCLHFGLPLSYGGWRRRTPTALCRWLDTKALYEGVLL